MSGTMFSVVIPVLNGERYLDEVLTAISTQQGVGEIEVLVIDSGSGDRSPEIARSHGVDLLEIPQSEFGHGRTRNLGMMRTSGEFVAFLTQDATPASERWLAAYADAFGLHDHVGAAYGPHLPRPGTNPLMARLLTDFFGGFSPDAMPVVHTAGDVTYLSNSNSCVARAAWEQIPFRDIPYAEDQALGSDLLAAGWTKVFHPDAAVLHAHDYGTIESFKRYFDEYRGLRDSVGRQTEAKAAGILDILARSVRADAKYLHENEPNAVRRSGWMARSVVHHGGRIFFGGLGERAPRVPAVLRGALSLERRSDGVIERVNARPIGGAQRAIEEVFNEGVVPPAPARLAASLSPTSMSMPESPPEGESTTKSPPGDCLDIAWVIPPFAGDSGGHRTIFRIIELLERRGHRCSIWVDDPDGTEPHTAAGVRGRIHDDYAKIKAPVHIGFDHWSGCDLALATSWPTAYRIARLDHCAARAYFVQDHEPDFHALSADSIFAAHSYRLGLPCIAASPWLAQQLVDRYGSAAVGFVLGVDPSEYGTLEMPRRDDMVLFYARERTPRRAVPLGLMALAEVRRRCPKTRIVLYGARRPVKAPFDYEHVGVADSARLARLYSEATVGLSLSLTNYSLVPTEMMACGLPVVELAGRACESVFGHDGSLIKLASDDPASIADAVCELLANDTERERMSLAGRGFAAEHGWDATVDTIEWAIKQVVKARVVA